MKDRQVEQLKPAFITKFGGTIESVDLYFAPGRINLIGEHIDYNGGNVFPCALDFGTYAAVRKRADQQVHFASLNMEEEAVIDLNHVIYEEAHDWINYPKGVIKTFQEKKLSLQGFEILYYGNIPNGAGLSSSASLEVLTAVIINEMNGHHLERVELVKMCQKAENEFVGVNCGIMDQFAVGMGKAGQAILLNCDTLDYTYAPLELTGYKIIIGNTKKRRGLADSKYNERRTECDRALAGLQKKLSINYICDLDGNDFEENKNLIENPVDRKRAEHAVYENIRVNQALEALNKGDLSTFGSLINRSHDSLKDLYEVTGIELDTMVEEARKIEGVLGSRMTGAGFGGCTISIVPDDQVTEFIETVGKAYTKRTGLIPEFYVANTGNGAGRL